jgi:short subunit dehydrogenase-like uncharacterized protein
MVVRSMVDFFPATGRIVVLGSTGYTGELVVEALVRHGSSPTLAGRRRDRLEHLARKYGRLDFAVVDVADEASIDAVIGPGDILISTVGPFAKLGHTAVAAAVRNGAHYIDSTGEVDFVHAVRQRHHATATMKTVAVLPAFGYDFVPGILAGTLAAEEAATASQLRVGYFSTAPMFDGLSHGTRVTMAEGLLEPVLTRRDGSSIHVRAASKVASFHVRGKRKKAFLAAGTESLSLAERFPTLRTVEVYNGWFPRLSSAICLISKVSNFAARTPRGRSVVERLSQPKKRGAGGPDAATRSKSMTHVVAVASDASGNAVAEVHVEGPSVYTLTAELIAAAARRLVAGELEAVGVLSPVEAFGLEGLRGLCDEVRLDVVSH